MQAIAMIRGAAMADGIQKAVKRGFSQSLRHHPVPLSNSRLVSRPGGHAPTLREQG
jgi:hypothetical protein